MGNKDSRFKTVEPNVPKVSTKTVTGLTLQSYMGLWYDIASIPTSYTAPCDKSTAVYQLGSSGNKIHITNYCWKDGKATMITGVAVMEDENDPGKLIVKFDGVSEIGKYWIYETDYTTYSIVGGGSSEYLWILTRQPKIKADMIAKLLNKVALLGYDTSNIKLHASVFD